MLQNGLDLFVDVGHPIVYDNEFALEAVLFVEIVHGERELNVFIDHMCYALK